METGQDIEKRRFPWATMRIDLGGLVAAVAALFVAVLLSLIWGPLFLVGLAAMAVVILATRTAERAPPPHADVVVSPVDGVVTSISPGVPPAELRLAGSNHVRVRIASSPASAYSIHAPLAGEIASLIEEAGDPNTRLAGNADEAGLAQAFVTFSRGIVPLGVRVAAGGLGPRLDITAEAGDSVRVGRLIGVRRLGGWCDVWLPGNAGVAVWPGMTLKGAETQLTRSSGEGAAAPAPEAEAEPFPMPTLDDLGSEAVLDDSADAEEAADATTETPEEKSQPAETSGDEESKSGSGDASEQFERLRKKVEAQRKDSAD